jgi:putative phosphoribosyl transferase
MGHTGHTATARSRREQIPSGQLLLEGELSVPVGAPGVVLFAHSSGSSRHSPRNQFVARTIREAGVGTLLFDLLTPEEETVDIRKKLWNPPVENEMD